MPIIALLMVPVILILVKKYAAAKTGGTASEDQTNARGGQAGMRPLTDEEQIEKIRQEMAAMQDEFVDEPRKKQEKRETTEVEEEEKIFITQQDIDDDDSIQEFTDGQMVTPKKPKTVKKSFFESSRYD